MHLFAVCPRPYIFDLIYTSPGDGDIDSVTGVHLVQLENRQLKIEKFNKLYI